jgi:hypothetical protein
MQKQWHQIDCEKHTCLQYEGWNEKTRRCLLLPQPGMCRVGTSIFCHSTHVSDDQEISVHIDLEVTDKS